MRNIICCYLMCKFNSAKMDKDEAGNIICKDDFGSCNCEDEIVLGSYECEECGCDNDGLQCMSFVSKVIKF